MRQADPARLPVEDALPALQDALAGRGLAVLAAPPGSGKTTRVPLALRAADWLRGQRIVLLEPRRVAARACATFMAGRLDEAVGGTVGYQVRFERKVSAATRIEVLTEGLLTRRLQAEPDLPGVGLVIVDEFHERSLHADLALALLLDARVQLRPDLRVLVMSATLDVARVAALIGDEHGPAPVVEASGRQYPVRVRHRAAATPETLPQAVAEAARAALAESDGDVLAFLPGAPEIHRCERLCAGLPGVVVHPLYGALPAAAQDAALAPDPGGRRRLILSTNLAQTSLTVEGVTAVIDGGYVRIARHDLGAGADRLETVRISRAAAEQRAGRAGRLAPGIAYRLWSPEAEGHLAAQDEAEMLRADLSRMVLELAAWGETAPARLAWLEPPPDAAWQAAQTLLRSLEALDERGRITRHGRDLLALPLAPRQAQLLLTARAAGLGYTAAWIAALLENGGARSPDLLAELERVQAQPPPALRESLRQLLRVARVSPQEALQPEHAGALVASAFPERIARRREGARGVFLCVDGSEARLPPDLALAGADWLAIAHWQPGAARRIRLAAALDEADRRVVLDRHASWETEVRWDGAAVVAERCQRLGALVLRRQPLAPTDAAVAGHVGRCFLDALRALGVAALPWDAACRQWQARVLSLRRWRPDEGWPDVSDAGLAADFDAWLEPWLVGLWRRDQLAGLSLTEMLAARLDAEQRRKLARLAPTHLTVPSGSRLALEYATDGAPPVLAVKLQELFGLRHTPAVDDGRMAVALHLLSPARRPIQVTRDLAGFWVRTYAEVRRELKGRYPKHPWPDDPLTAPPTARAKPRQR